MIERGASLQIRAVLLKPFCFSSLSDMFPVFRLPLVVSDMLDDAALPRCALRGSLDPTTGIFYKAPERARARTAQACDKCRVRKAKVTFSILFLS